MVSFSNTMLAQWANQSGKREGGASTNVSLPETILPPCSRFAVALRLRLSMRTLTLTLMNAVTGAQGQVI